MDVPVTVEWDDPPQEAAVANLDELDALLDRIAAGADPEQPTVATISREDVLLNIAQGPTWAIVLCQYL